MPYLSFAHNFNPGDSVKFRQNTGPNDTVNLKHTIINVRYTLISAPYNGIVTYVLRTSDHKTFEVFEHELELCAIEKEEDINEVELN